MSLFGWSLPPGVRTSDLPGNSPAETAAEAAVDGLYEALYNAERAWIEAPDVLKLWREAAEQAFYDEAEEADAEAQAEIEREAQEREAEQYWATWQGEGDC